MCIRDRSIIINLIPCWEDNLLAFALRSNIESDGVSSTYKGAFSKELTFTFNCSHSWLANLPVLSFSDDKPVSEDINLVISWTEDISREKKATGRSLTTEIFLAIDNVKAVFPIPGLAAIIIKSLGCQPEVISSIFSNPEGTPLKPSFLDISSILFLAWNTKFCDDIADFLMFPWVISYNLDSASSSNSKTSIESWYESKIISLDIFISDLWIYFCWIILAWNSIWAEVDTFFVSCIK